MPFKDPEARKAYDREYQKRAWQEKRGSQYRTRQKLLAIVNEAKSVPCMDCGEKYPPYVMDFDHVRGVKVANVATLVGQSNERKLREEIEKCDVVCANCHRERTWNGEG